MELVAEGKWCLNSNMRQSTKFEIDYDDNVNVIKNYFKSLGGKEHDFSLDTANRVQSFGIELLQCKRNYEKFTMFA